MTTKEMIESLPESSLRWLSDQEKEWARRESKELPPIMWAVDFLKMDLSIPQWQLIDLEQQYRKGFYHGLVEAIDLIYRMKSYGGYLRPDEIANMLSNWCTDIRKWKDDVWHENPIENMVTPTLEWETWAEMKRQCHERDDWACTECGSVERLEAHHIQPVRYGGLPELSNLTTLCKSCHQSK